MICEIWGESSDLECQLLIMWSTHYLVFSCARYCLLIWLLYLNWRSSTEVLLKLNTKYKIHHPKYKTHHIKPNFWQTKLNWCKFLIPATSTGFSMTDRYICFLRLGFLVTVPIQTIRWFEEKWGWSDDKDPICSCAPSVASVCALHLVLESVQPTMVSPVAH